MSETPIRMITDPVLAAGGLSVAISDHAALAMRERARGSLSSEALAALAAGDFSIAKAEMRAIFRSVSVDPVMEAMEARFHHLAGGVAFVTRNRRRNGRLIGWAVVTVYRLRS